MFKAVFFDFDGVIVDSANIKTDAFYELFLKFGEEKAGLIKEYHLKHQGISRFKKFEYIFDNIVPTDFTEALKWEYSENFSKIVFHKILNSNYIPGVLDFLEELKRKNIKSFLLSATPEDELVKICLSRDISHYFANIYGSPKTKVEHGKKILKEFSYSPDEILFFGDSKSDFEASQELGTKFIGVGKKSNIFPSSILLAEDFRGVKIESL